MLVYFNEKALSEYFLLDENTGPALLAPVINEFAASYDTHIKSLQENLRSKNYQAIQQTAHNLKSSSRLLGLEIMGELCSNIEEDALQNKCNPEYIEELFVVSPASIEALQEYMDSHTKQGSVK